MTTARNPGPGFQGSETSSAELVIYAGSRDPVLDNAGDSHIEFSGRKRSDQMPSLISLSTNKSMGTPAGVWSATVKADHVLGGKLDLRDVIVDDQWADITFKRHGRSYHTMRGLVDRVQRTTVTGGGGTTTRTYTITGRDFGKIWQMTPIWFNRYASQNVEGENIAGSAIYRVFTELQQATPGVDGAVQAFLFNFLQALGSVGRANWLMPENMPNVTINSAFTDNVVFDTAQFTNDPPRWVSVFNFLDPSGANSWPLAQEWSDPAFCELWCDTAPVRIGDGETITDFGNLENQDQIPIANTSMVVVLRDRPFPTVDQGFDSLWYELPEAIVATQEIVQDDVGRGGEERFNAFFVGSTITQEFINTSLVEITAPLWDPADIRIHGLRRYDINSRYRADVDAIAAQDTELLAITKNQRKKVRDWYCLNPYLLSGNLQLGHGRPDIHIGMRLRIPGLMSALDKSYYVEQVGHEWQLQRGVRTSVGVTRGWEGDNDSYLSALRRQASRYTGSDRQTDTGLPGILT